MKLVGIENLSQLDPRWAGTTLGTSGTIKLYGCALICVTETCNYYGHKVTPLEVNELLKQNGGYVADPKTPKELNLMNWTAVSKFFPDITFDKKIDCKTVPAPLDVIDSYLLAGKPVIAFVDYNPLTPEPEQHFVLIIGKDEQGEYICNDPISKPGDGSYYLSAKYGKPEKAICGLRLYSGVVPVITPPTPPTPPQNNDLEVEKKLNDLSEKVVNNANQVNILNDTVNGLVKKINDMQIDITEIYKDRDTLSLIQQKLTENTNAISNVSQANTRSTTELKGEIRLLGDTTDDKLTALGKRIKILEDKPVATDNGIEIIKTFFGKWFIGRIK